MTDATDYSKEYSEESFWKKLGGFAVRAGKEVVEKALTLYYCLLDPDTPKRAKATIIGALGYFIAPFDAITDLIPVVGFSDDLGVLVLALAMVATHIKPEHREKARETLKTWFGSAAGEEDEGPHGDSSLV
ncbi:MAG: YkvA family protein [Acidobacteriota bacterium]|nr:YkvA family protein [Acidobacteriota bacterium]